MTGGCPLPEADPQTGLKVLRGLARERSLLAALAIMRADVGPAFRIALPGFRPAVFVGPEGNRQIMISGQADFRWRGPSDPVTKLLRHGVLVEDGASHAALRGHMEPVLQKGHVVPHVPTILTYTDRVLDTWADGETRDMLVEMRRLALLIFMGALLDVEFGPDLERLWEPILKLLKYISPGLWILWPDMPRPGYDDAIRQIDAYLYGIIADRRRQLAAGGGAPLPGSPAPDLLTQLVLVPGMSDDLIRDQLLTMLIAGHDTSTALLAWALYLLGEHPAVMAAARAEVDAVVGRGPLDAAAVARLEVLDTVIKEALRLYPPIHVGNRFVAKDTTVSGYELRAGERVMASIYLSHRDERYWDAPEQFRPERFARGVKPPPPLTYVPFGAGPRVCIGAAFAQLEARVVLARILQRFELTSVGRKARAHMGATLEPRPGVFLAVSRR